MAFTVVIASPQGGSGRTTLVAQLAMGLSESRLRCLAVELDPQNTMSLHLGDTASAWVSASLQRGGDAHTLGIVHPEADARALAAQLRARRMRLPHIPFGTCDRATLARFVGAFLKDREWLRHRLRSLTPAHCDLMLIDTPAGRNPITDAALGVADLIVIPVLADAAGAALLPGYERYLAEVAPKARSLYVINRWDPARALSCDVLEVLRGALSGRLFERAILEDETIRERLARGPGGPLDVDSQAAVDLAALSAVVCAAMGLPGGDAPLHHN